MSTAKTLGIMVYIDRQQSMLDEFSWLYKSWIYSGNWRNSDLIVVHHPDVAAYLPRNDPGVISISCMPAAAPGTIFEGYHFINSIACLIGPHVDAISSRYTHLLRTDADVFLTENLVGLRPAMPVHGRGLYHRSEGFRVGMLDFCARHGIEHRNHFGCGSTLLAQSHLVRHMLERQTYWTEKVLADFAGEPGVWPGWWRGVASMYASEIVCNEFWIDYIAYGRERILDVESFCQTEIDPLVYHIHAVPTDDYFSKTRFRSGDYGHIDISGLNRRIIREYCHWLAAIDVDAVKQIAGYDP